jgi:hypothetical protein
MAVVATNSGGKYGRQYFCYVVLHGGPSEHQVYEAYRRRFGIESSCGVCRRVARAPRDLATD